MAESTSPEVWRPIPGYERTYSVSSWGRVYSVPRRKTRGGLLSISVGKRGYPIVNLNQDGIQRTSVVHRLVALAFLGDCPDGLEVRHLDGNKTNNYVANLIYGTRSENVQDMIRHGANRNTAKTHCPQGHPYDERNTSLYKGWRYCRGCQRDYRQRVKQAKERRDPEYDPTWAVE